MKVLTIEQMNKLKELGVDVSNASVRVGQMVFYHGDSWYGVDSYNVHLLKDDDDDTSCFEEEYKAFTLQDIIELLPKRIDDYQLVIWLDDGYVRYETEIGRDDEGGYVLAVFDNTNIIQAAYEMLLWVIENGYLKTK